MDTLFPLPKAAKSKPRTPTQLQMLDLVALYEGQPMAEPLRRHGFARIGLRRVMAAKLVECVALGPARYMLTPLGRWARSNGRGGKNESGRVSAAAG